MNIFELLKSILGFFDTQLASLFGSLRVKSPSVYLAIVSLLIGGNHYITESVGNGSLKLNDTGIFLVWLISFVLPILTRPAIGTQSVQLPPQTEINDTSQPIL